MNHSEETGLSESTTKSKSFPWQIVAVWSVILLLATFACWAFVIFILPYLLRPLFPQGRFMIYLFRLLTPLSITIWGTGIYFAYRRHRSMKVAVSLIIVSGFVLITAPIWGYLLILAFAGGWNVK
ncbi:hypothetical protein [Gimesia maris]|uniref:Uncharacterized protein n=1 Tax=Gimesia maris TaxID=122 RepID=A0ABX5YQS9_9PLAN|nr:hypothetical protein [Gimesia maris]EDL59699.1 hypothetical protein PM8797T_24851 [Gimesia maris DSM 8797]QDU15917.1 hypothetical protein CA11_37450 [Gimesia maris]QEG17945.1 hypothetical protein GmarT_38290 [Gimesia maris]QGQ29029.1 hypothetical protein F1729_10425 [Gimesia maris]